MDIAALLTQDLKPKSMPVLVIMPDNHLSFGVRCDSAPPKPAVQCKPPPEGEGCADEPGAALLLSGAHPSATQPAAAGAQPTLPAAVRPLPNTAGGHDDAAWQHGYACGTAAAAAALGRQSGQQAPQPGGAAGCGAAVPVEGDVETGLPTAVRSLHVYMRETCT